MHSLYTTTNLTSLEFSLKWNIEYGVCVVASKLQNRSGVANNQIIARYLLPNCIVSLFAMRRVHWNQVQKECMTCKVFSGHGKLDEHSCMDTMHVCKNKQWRWYTD